MTAGQCPRSCMLRSRTPRASVRWDAGGALTRRGAGDEKGNLYVFDPMHAVKTAAMNKDGTRGPTSLLSFHKDRILSICFAPGPDPTAPRPRVVTASACHRIGVWDVKCEKTWGAVQLVGRIRAKDFVPTSVCALVSGVYQPGTTGVLVATNTAAVRPASWCRSPANRTCDLSTEAFRSGACDAVGPMQGCSRLGTGNRAQLHAAPDPAPSTLRCAWPAGTAARAVFPTRDALGR